MRRAGSALLLLAVAWAGVSQARAFSSQERGRRERQPERADRPSAERCRGVSVSAVTGSSQEATRRRRNRDRFKAHEVLDLELSVWLSVKSEASLVEIHVYTPTGRLYEVLRATADAGSPDGVRHRDSRTRLMSARLPVAGSHITSRSLYGRWRAEVFLDGSAQACTPRATEFVIDR